MVILLTWSELIKKYPENFPEMAKIQQLLKNRSQKNQATIIFDKTQYHLYLSKNILAFLNESFICFPVLVKRESPIGDGGGRHSLQYFDIAYPIKSTWLKFQFQKPLDTSTEDSSANVASFRFNIYGCEEAKHDANSGIERQFCYFKQYHSNSGLIKF